MTNSTSQISKLEALFTYEDLWVINVLFRDINIETDFFSDEASQYICNFCKRNGLASLMYRNQYSDYLTARSKLELRKEYLFNLGRNTAFQLVAEEIVNLLHEYQIPSILLKGSFLAPYVYKDVAYRPMSDIDILVPPGQEHKAWQLLNPEGDISQLFDDPTGHHVPSFIFRGCSIEIHRDLFPVNLKYTLPLDEILSGTLPIAGKHASTIEPQQMVIYLAIHIYYSYRRGGIRLGWFYDFSALVKHYGDQISINDIETIAKKWKVWEPVKLMLSFYTILAPGNSLSISISKEAEKEIEAIILLLQTSENSKNEYSYGVTIERFFHTKGFRNKCSFIWNILTVQKNQRKKLSLYRVWYLLKNTVRYLKKRIFR